MADARVICSIERLFDWEPANQAVIGVTLSAAWGNTTNGPPANFLLPWKWLPWQQGPDKLGFYWACVADDASAPARFSQAPIFPQSLTRNGNSLASIRNGGNYQDFAENAIQLRYLEIRKNLANLGYPAGGQNSVTVTASASDGPGDISKYGSGAFWPTILADLSTRPAPIPHALLLSFVFQLGNIEDLLPKRGDGTTPDPANCHLLIAPVLTTGATGKGSDTNPAVDAAALSNGTDPSSKLWNYADQGYQASSQMVALGGPPSRTSFFDLATRLVKSAGTEKWHFNEDWQSSFESRLGERLDLSAELVRIAEKEAFDDATTRNVIDAAIAAFRDIVGIGIDVAPSKVSFLQTSNVDPATIAKINAALPASTFRDLSGWKNFLQKNVFGKPETILSDSYLAGLDLWNSGPIKAADAVLQFNRVRQKLLAPDALWALLQLQISVLAPGLSVKQPSNLNALPATLRAENLGRYWGRGLLQALVAPSGGYSADAIRIALGKQLQQLAISRFSDGGFFPHVSAAVATAAATSLNTQTSSKDWFAAAQYAMPSAASKPSADPGQGATALAPQGITIQINEVGNTANVSVAGNEADQVRKFQGAGLLLGYDVTTNGNVSTNGYKCLNYADVYYLSISGGAGTGKVLEHAALTPLRFTWHNDVALATVSYNNEPLPASGPLSRAAKLVSAGGGDSIVTVGTDLLWYSYPTSDKPDPQHKDPKTALTALTYGRDYHPQPFLMSNSGAIPNSLATTYLDLKTGTELDKAKGIGDTWASISYRRQALPGALRLSNTNAGTEKHLKLPVIPDGVFARVTAEEDQPVVMLVPPDQTRFTNLATNFDINVRPPATDLLTWDRFVNGFGNGLAGARSAVFDGFLAEVARHAEPRADTTIDDPATVYSGYDCRLYYELLDEDGTQVAADFIKFPAPSGAGIAAVQAGVLHFSFQAASQGSNPSAKKPSIKVTPPQITITVYEGRFATLRLHACVHKDYFSRFEAGLLPGATLTGSYYVLKPTNIVVEVATDALPSETDLFDTNNFQLGAFNPLDGTAQVSLKLAGMRNGQYVYSAEVLRQVWKWQGRPVAPLPVAEDVPSEWLIREFGTRADTDLLRTPMLPPPVGDSTYVFTEQRGSLLTDADRSSGNLQRAAGGISVPAESRLLGTYIRYGTQVESRYKPLLIQNGYIRAKGADGGLWRNRYIPSRKLTQIKPPDVKLILPLTRNASDPKGGPGLLVMLRGPWFQECGLGERLEARIALVETPEEDPQTTTRKTLYYQYGPDPILFHAGNATLAPVAPGQTPESGWGDNVTNTKKQQAKNARNQKDTIRGPIGHTFDTVSSGQLFVNTSFVLNYPVVENLDWTPWSFCKVQVRRVVDVIGRPSPAAASDWSPPTWIQLLPDFDLYSANTFFADLVLGYQASSKYFQLLDKTGNAVTLMAGNGDGIYANYLAVTHFVSDATGVPAQETYDGLYQQSGVNWIPLGGSAAGPGDVQTYYRARVLTVQGKKPSVVQEDVFWDNIFTVEKDPGNPNGVLTEDLDRLRIVAVSRPIDVPNAQYRGC